VNRGNFPDEYGLRGTVFETRNLIDAVDHLIVTSAF
jgi:hypothetical protein